MHLEANDFRDQHRNRLAEHGRFRFNAANTPAEHTQSVDHCGVRVRTDEGIGIREGFAVLLACEDTTREIFEVHLVDDAGVRRHHAEVAERGLPPAEECIALAIALQLLVRVDEERRL